MTGVDAGILVSAAVLLACVAISLSFRDFSRGLLLLSTSCILLVLVLAARSSQIGAASAALPVLFTFAAGTLAWLGMTAPIAPIPPGNRATAAGVGGALVVAGAAWFGNPFVVLFVVLFYSAVLPVWFPGARSSAWAGLLFLFASLLLFASGRFLAGGGPSARSVTIWAGIAFFASCAGSVILAEGSLRERIGIVLPHFLAACCLLFRPDPA